MTRRLAVRLFCLSLLLLTHTTTPSDAVDPAMFGIIFGISASWLIACFAGWQFALPFSAILLGLGVSNAVGIFFGYYPARQGSLIDPVVALKSD